MFVQAYSSLGGIRNENISHIPFDQTRSNATTYEELLAKVITPTAICSDILPRRPSSPA